jgi:hypothetical protein
MTRTDKEALERCVALALAGDEARALQIREMLQSEPWEDVAAFAAYGIQMRSLRLRPWESPPCWASEDESGPAGALLRKMLKAGLSRYEPDPLQTLETAR